MPRKLLRILRGSWFVPSLRSGGFRRSRPVIAAAEAEAETKRRPGPARLALTTQPQAIVGLVIIALFVAVAVFSPVILSQDPKTKVGPVFAHPSGGHLLGTDGGGADML